jgi:hypothetical protein
MLFVNCYETIGYTVAKHSDTDGNTSCNSSCKTFPQTVPRHEQNIIQFNLISLSLVISHVYLHIAPGSWESCDGLTSVLGIV